MKKLVSILLALVLVLSLSTVAFADDPISYTIIIDDAIEAQTYTAYKIFDASYTGTVAANNLKVSYTISTGSPWYATVVATAGITLQPTVDDTVKTVTYDDTFDPAVFAAALNSVSKTGITAAGTSTANYTTATPPVYQGTHTIDVTSSGAGYYFVDSSVGALCSLDTTVPTVTIDEKNTSPVLVKRIMVGETENEYITASIGDTVTFRIGIAAGGAADTSYVVNDTMEPGFTYVADSISITDGTGAALANTETTTYYTGPVISDYSATNGTSIQVTFPASYTSTLETGDMLYINYSAILNPSAKIFTTSAEDPAGYNANTANLTYGATTTPNSVVMVYTYGFDLFKVDETKAPLLGAEFELYTAAENGTKINLVYDSVNGVYRPATAAEAAAEGFTSAKIAPVGNTAEARIVGLAGASTYYLDEVTTPAGYNKIQGLEAVALVSTNRYTTDYGVTVQNIPGVALPGTGGMGTNLFTIVGLLFIASAGLFLALNRKKIFDK